MIDSPSGQFTNTGTHSSSLWLSLLAIVQQGRALECAFVALNGMSTHCHAYQKYTRSLWSRDTPLYSGRFRWHQWCLHYRGSTVFVELNNGKKKDIETLRHLVAASKDPSTQSTRWQTFSSFNREPYPSSIRTTLVVCTNNTYMYRWNDSTQSHEGGLF